MFLDKAERVCYTSKVYYYYFINPQGIAATYTNKTNEDAVEAIKLRIQFLINKNYKNKYIAHAYGLLIRSYIGQYFYCDVDKNVLINKLNETVREAKQRKINLDFKTKIKLLLFKYNKKLLKKLL